MLTLIVRTKGDTVALVETLDPLVEGVVKGLIGRLFIVAPGMTAAPTELLHVVREAGADLILLRDWQAGLAEAASRASTARLCIVDAGVIAGETFFPALDRFLRRAGAGPDAVAATRRRSRIQDLVARPIGRTSEDQIVILPRKEAANGVWSRNFGSRLTLLECTSHRMRAL